ncbi:MAG TPA: hypothetical protein VNB06_21040 [Thermoanaerobaculia bacterium]|nr:hypothetical protein [Thermoanaerobaculia bacterium]
MESIGERALLGAIIEQAVRDARSRSRSSPQRRRAARQWLVSADCQAIISALGLDAARLRRRLLEELVEPEDEELVEEPPVPLLPPLAALRRELLWREAEALVVDPAS